MEFKRISNYDINITHTANGGMIVRVGCATLSFSNPEDMMDIMKQYYENPDGMEKQYNNASSQDVPQPDYCSEESSVGEVRRGPVANRANAILSSDSGGGSGGGNRMAVEETSRR